MGDAVATIQWDYQKISKMLQRLRISILDSPGQGSVVQWSTTSFEPDSLRESPRLRSRSSHLRFGGTLLWHAIRFDLRAAGACFPRLLVDGRQVTAMRTLQRLLMPPATGHGRNRRRPTRAAPDRLAPRLQPTRDLAPPRGNGSADPSRSSSPTCPPGAGRGKNTRVVKPGNFSFTATAFHPNRSCSGDDCR